jgi:hypothetical protein
MCAAISIPFRQFADRPADAFVRAHSDEAKECKQYNISPAKMVLHTVA